MIRTFQLKNGLLPDGKVGPKTARALMEYFGISTPEKAAHFLGQMSHESGGFQYSEENLKYSAEGLLRVFKRYFTRESAERYAYQPKLIASRVYANRMGNGDEQSMEGYKFRGRGPLQLTGKNNYEQLASKMRDLRIIDNPDLVAKEYYFESALFFFNENRLWPLCQEVDDASILKVTKRINGGTNGLLHRIEETKKFYKWLAQ